MGAINGLCENSIVWYKENQVEMIYTYMDENDQLVTIFKIHSSKVIGNQMEMLLICPS